MVMRRSVYDSFCIIDTLSKCSAFETIIIYLFAVLWVCSLEEAQLGWPISFSGDIGWPHSHVWGISQNGWRRWRGWEIWDKRDSWGLPRASSRQAGVHMVAESPRQKQERAGPNPCAFPMSLLIFLISASLIFSSFFLYFLTSHWPKSQGKVQIQVVEKYTLPIGGGSCK